MNKVCRGPKAPCRTLSRLSQDSLNLAFKHAAQGACCPACSRRARSYATLPSQVLPSGRAGLKVFLTQFLDSYTIVCPACPVHTHGGGGGCRYLDMSVGGGGAEFLRLFCHFWDPRWEICHSGGPQMTVSGWFTPPHWEICHSGVPQMTVSGCFSPPPDGKSVILAAPR